MTSNDGFLFEDGFDYFEMCVCPCVGVWVCNIHLEEFSIQLEVFDDVCVIHDSQGVST